MKKIDYFIFGGLVLSLIVFLYLTSLSSSSQNAAVLENQKLIKQTLNSTSTLLSQRTPLLHTINQTLAQAENNSERIIQNQHSILNISRGLQKDRELLLNHSEAADHEQEENQDMIKQLLNATLENQKGFVGQHNKTQNLVREVITLLNQTHQ